MLVMHRGTFSRDRPDVQGATIELKVNYDLVRSKDVPVLGNRSNDFLAFLHEVRGP